MRVIPQRYDILISVSTAPTTPNRSACRPEVLALFDARREAWMRRAAETPLADLHDTDAVGVVDSYCGQGALMLGMAAEDIPIGRYFGIDLDPVSGLLLMATAEYCMARYPRCVTWPSVAHIFHLWRDAEEIREEGLQTLGRIHLFGCGAPCQPFSQANRNSSGFADPRAQLFVAGVRLRDSLRRLANEKGETLYFLFENVRPAPWLDYCRKAMDTLTGVTGICWDSGRISASSRNRVWWTNEELGYGPPPFQWGPTLAEALRACGGIHTPRIATRDDTFNVAGEHMMTAPTVMASRRTGRWSPRRGARGRGCTPTCSLAAWSRCSHTSASPSWRGRRQWHSLEQRRASMRRSCAGPSGTAWICPRSGGG
jgi:hypothetical protein